MKKYTLHVVRVSKKTNDFTESKPCNHCLNTLKKYGIKKIVYSTKNGRFVKSKVSKLHTTHKSMAFRQISKHCRV